MHIQPSTVPVLEGLSARAADFDIILCDIWGVLHNGVNAYPSASKALRNFREAGGRVILVSNAPRPGTDVIGLLDGFGVDRLAYDGIVTSGDVTWSLLAAGSWKRYHWLGPKRDGNLFNGLAMTPSDLADADVIICTGLIDDRVETAETYRSFLAEALALKLPMVCANPDLVVERGGQIIHCAGAIAKLYEELGGEAIYAGKPYPRIYDAALAVASSM
jgi:HAD superfamily hydrolase (TIGR01459 family)